MNKITSINPATEKILGEVDCSTEEDVNNAVKKARQALPEWKKVSYEEKADLLKKVIEDINKKKKELAELLTKEMGKPLNEAESEIKSTPKKIEFFIDKVKDYVKPENPIPNATIYFEQVGVVGVITPWNFPFSLPTWPIVPSLLIGNTIVFKPSELTTLVGAELIKIFNKHLPENVLNIIIGADDVGKTLVKTDIDMVSFVGSTAAGKNIMKNSADKLHKLVLELGGKDPAIVLSDVDINFAAQAIAGGAIRNCGQICCSIERVYVVKEIADEFINKIVEEFKKIKVGNGLNPEIDVGPLVSKQQLENFISHIKDAKQKGAKILFGGNKIEGKGYFHEPTVLRDVNNEMKIMAEETFGPALPIQIVSDEEEAIKLANALPYGLTASVWTKDNKKAEKISRQLEAGNVGINRTAGSDNELPWGGIKQSGIGRSLSKHGVREFTNMKVVMCNEFVDK